MYLFSTASHNLAQIENLFEFRDGESRLPFEKIHKRLGERALTRLDETYFYGRFSSCWTTIVFWGL